MDRRPALEDASPQPDLWAEARRAPKPKPHYLGHRDRLRERAAAGGLAALPDYEVLELLLFRSIGRGDVKPLAKQLLGRFGSLGAVLAADAEALKSVRGVGEAVALDLRLLQEAALRAAREQAARRTVISSWSALLAYVKTALAHEPREQGVLRPKGTPRFPPVVRADNQASGRYTILDIVATNALGLLYRISRVISRHGCDVDLVLIATEGEKAIDVFHITKGGSKLTEAEQQALTSDLHRTLEGSL